MEHVFLVIHLMLALAITGLVLLQRSEGGGLGMGGGGMGGLSTPQATANALTKATAFCAACFFATSLILGILANGSSGGESILDKMGGNVPAVATDAPDTTDKAADDALTETTETPTVPISE